MTKQLIERIYALSGELNDKGQYLFYGRVAGCLITGNEDGIKHCAQNVLYSLQHVGYTIPPNADAGWIGEAGPGPSYLDPGSGGPENDFTNRNTTFMTWNLMHLAKMLKDAGGRARVRQPAHRVGRRHPLRLGEPRVPVVGGRRHDGLMPGPIVGDDGLARCPWAAGHPVNREYHDTEWGRPIQGEAAHLERLTLEAFQSGLSWLTILNKRPAFRAAFADFDAETVAAYDDADRARLMADVGIVRNRLKIDAAITNARATVALRAQGGLAAYVEGFRPEVGPAPATTEEMVTTSPESVALSKGLKKQGFVFVGPTTMYALMEAIGIVDDHLVGCHRRGADGLTSGNRPSPREVQTISGSPASLCILIGRCPFSSVGRASPW